MAADRLFSHLQFETERVVAAKDDERVAVIIPARNEATTIKAIVSVIGDELIDAAPLVDELIVVDDHSEDDTTAVAGEGGARVVASAGHGKGAALWTGLRASSASIVVFCDGDLREFGTHFVTGLCGPLLTRDDLVLVKAKYERPRDGLAGEGGRVTELAAKPALRLLAPELAFISQPLSGELAARREALEVVPFVEGYGVDVALLLDIAFRFGAERIGEVDLGIRYHRNRPLSELAGQADQVLHAVFDRVGAGNVEPVAELPPLRRVRGAGRLVVVDVADVLDEAGSGLGVL